jgi:hypothetical protein
MFGRLFGGGRSSSRRGRIRGRRLLRERRSGVCHRNEQRQEKPPSSIDVHQASLVTAVRVNPNPSTLTHFRRVGNEFGNEKAGPKGLTERRREDDRPAKRDDQHSRPPADYGVAEALEEFREPFLGANRPSPYRRKKCPVAGRTELDDLLIAVAERRDGKAFTVLFDHFRPRVQAQLVHSDSLQPRRKI